MLHGSHSMPVTAGTERCASNPVAIRPPHLAHSSVMKETPLREVRRQSLGVTSSPPIRRIPRTGLAVQSRSRVFVTQGEGELAMVEPARRAPPVRPVAELAAVAKHLVVVLSRSHTHCPQRLVRFRGSFRPHIPRDKVTPRPPFSPHREAPPVGRLGELLVVGKRAPPESPAPFKCLLALSASESASSAARTRARGTCVDGRWLRAGRCGVGWRRGGWRWLERGRWRSGMVVLGLGTTRRWAWASGTTR